MPERYLGQTLGKFRVDAIIGSGGFAWVYKAYDPELEIPVALKILKPQYAGDATFEERFRREASTAAKLRHPNIIKIYAVGREGEAVYFAMDYLPQGLADRLNVMTTLPESMLIRMAIDVASALGFAHREGVIHRDIKTDNILFDEHGNAIVADFGIARAVSSYNEQTGTNMVVGTPQYFSPEQARGLQLDGRADLYSLGVTLFKAATGQLPFSGTDWYEIARQHVEDKPPKPRSVNPQLSRELEDVILTCLEKDPADRFQSGEAMCEELLRILQERGETAAIRTIMVPPADTLSSPRSAPRWKRRVRRVARGWWIGAGVAALLAIGVVARSARDTASAHTTRPPDTVQAGLSVPPPPRDSGARRTAAAPPVRRLVVESPAGARVAINGDTVSSGTWESTALAPGTYDVVASVRAIAGCPTAQVRGTIAVTEAGLDTVLKLNPRDCGYLMVEADPTGGEYTVTSLGGERNRVGMLPMKGPLMLPSGVYRLRIVKPYCVAFTSDDVRISAGSTRTLPVKLFCGQG